MKKRKKVNNDLSHQKISIAHHRNEFIRNLKEFCDKTIHQNIFLYMPDEAVNNLYKIRSQPIKIRTTKGVPNDTLIDMKRLITDLLKHKQIDFGVGDIACISLHDYFTNVLTLILYAKDLKIDAYKNAFKVKEILSAYSNMGDGDIYKKAWFELDNVAKTAVFFYNNLSKYIFVIKHELTSSINGRVGLCNCLDVYAIQPERTHVVIEGVKRPVFGVAFGIILPTPHLMYATINPETLGMPSGKPFTVFIQAHALNRLEERLDGIITGLLQFNLFDSLMKQKVCKSKKGEYLFDYFLFGKKVGYLCGNLVDDKIIIRTFLFITNNGTPEGEKLHANTGIMKEDKMYLAIDKLSTFIRSDIEKNEVVKNMFIKAGCASLFEIDDKVIFEQQSLKEKNNAELIAQYLKLLM